MKCHFRERSRERGGKRVEITKNRRGYNCQLHGQSNCGTSAVNVFWEKCIPRYNSRQTLNYRNRQSLPLNFGACVKVARSANKDIKLSCNSISMLSAQACMLTCTHINRKHLKSSSNFNKSSLYLHPPYLRKSVLDSLSPTACLYSDDSTLVW